MSLSLTIELVRAARDAEELGRAEEVARLLDEAAPDFEFRDVPKPERMSLRTESWDAYLRAAYRDVEVQALAMREHPLLGMLRKKD